MNYGSNPYRGTTALLFQFQRVERIVYTLWRVAVRPFDNLMTATGFSMHQNRLENDARDRADGRGRTSQSDPNFRLMDVRSPRSGVPPGRAVTISPLVFPNHSKLVRWTARRLEYPTSAESHQTDANQSR